MWVGPDHIVHLWWSLLPVHCLPHGSELCLSSSELHFQAITINTMLPKCFPAKASDEGNRLGLDIHSLASLLGLPCSVVISEHTDPSEQRSQLCVAAYELSLLKTHTAS